MIIRPTESTDYNKVIELYSQQGCQPNFNNFMTASILERDGQVLGFVGTRTIAEAIIFVDQTLSKRIRIGALKELISSGARPKGYEHVHAFVLESDFSEILKKHFNFREAVGTCLIMEINNGQG